MVRNMKPGIISENGNVNWKYTPVRHVDAHRFNQILDVLENKLGYSAVKPDGNKRHITSIFKLRNHYFISTHGDYGITANIYLSGDGIWYPYRITTRRNRREDTNNVSGYEAWMRICQRFKERNKKTIIDVFGSDEGDDCFWNIKKCVPAPINWANPECLNLVWNHCYKGDVSSCYPYEATKVLPTLHGRQIVEGRVPPTVEYPFAFYPGDGSLAIFNEFDSIYFYSREEYKYQSNDTGCEEETILCKAAEPNELAHLMTDLYEMRHTRKEAKDWMNLFVGYCQMNSRPALCHISAVVIARANHRMFMLTDELRSRNQRISLINCDSIMWKGEDQPGILSNVKTLGAFYGEYRDIMSIVSGPKKYQLKDELGVCKTVWAGVDRDAQASLEFGEASLKDIPMTMYRWDTNIGRLVWLYVDEYGEEAEGGII